MEYPTKFDIGEYMSGFVDGVAIHREIRTESIRPETTTEWCLANAATLRRLDATIRDLTWQRNCAWRLTLVSFLVAVAMIWRAW
jgi:hypothetical protein